MTRGGALLVAVAVVAACAKQPVDATHLQVEDLTAPADFVFDANAVVDAAALGDWQSISVERVQQFLEKTPYKRASFLATYQSNGMRASDAIARAASTYRINPLFFLVRAEADQGLVGEQQYPAPSTRVEYVFDCGCPGVGACDPSLAGFDRQVECLGYALRRSLDEIAETGVTSGGWSPGYATRTQDGQTVTPAEAGTAALYQYTPAVNVGRVGGTWIFWSIWQRYAEALGYAPPVGEQPDDTRWVGDRCREDSDCGLDRGTCQTNYPGGLCTRDCTRSDCPEAPSRPATFCANIDGAASCLAVCDPNVPESCREGYRCVSVERFGASERQFVCAPG